MSSDYEVHSQDPKNGRHLVRGKISLSHGGGKVDLLDSIRTWIPRLEDVILTSEDVEIEVSYEEVETLSARPLIYEAKNPEAQPFLLLQWKKGQSLKTLWRKQLKTFSAPVQLTYIYVVPKCLGCYYDAPGQRDHMEHPHGCMYVEEHRKKPRSHDQSEE